MAMPLYEGRMIGQFDYSQKGWVSGKGRGAEWREIEWQKKWIEPQYLMSLDKWKEDVLSKYLKGFAKHHTSEEVQLKEVWLQDPKNFNSWWLERKRKVAFIDVTSATNARTMLSTFLSELPCGNSAPVLNGHKISTLLPVALNSLVYDWVVRFRCSGNHLNWFIIDESVLPLKNLLEKEQIKILSLSLAACAPRMSEFWIIEKHKTSVAWKQQWGLSRNSRGAHNILWVPIDCFA